MQQFNKENFHSLCDLLGKQDKAFGKIIREYGYPPMWTRPASFATLIHIILEQQVSLASAKAAFVKLKARLGTITPAKLLQLSDAEMRACYFSRQKTIYARHLAEMLVSKELQLHKIRALPDESIKIELKKVKGIGEWTADIYLIFALQRPDIFPTGDLAMMQALKEVMQLPKEITKDEIILMAESWRPHRSVATMLLWHHYLRRRGL